MADTPTSVDIGDHYAEYARRKVEAGEYATTGDVVREALRMTEERDARIAALREAIREGEESGPAEAFEFDLFLKEMRASYKGAA